MPRRSKIEIAGFSDQVRIWLEEGKTEEWIVTQLKERGFQIDQASVNRFKKHALNRIKLPLTRISTKWNKDAGDALAQLQALQNFMDETPVKEGIERDVRETINTRLTILREKLKLLGQYPKEGVQIGVQVITDTRASVLRQLLESLPNDVRESVRKALLR